MADQVHRCCFAPVLARDFTVVAPDLRGYGDSSKPPTTDDHAPYSKRAIDSGHFLPEEAPEETARELRALFAE